MIDIPAFGGDISFLEGMAAVALFATGYVIHEVLHLLPLHLFGHEVRVLVLPTASGETRWQAVLRGRVVEIEIHDPAPRWHVALSALAPLAMAVVPVYGLALAYARPVVDIGTFLALFAWFAVSIPSPRDWAMALHYRPNQVTHAKTEVRQHG